MSSENVVDQVRAKYAAVAASELSSEHAGVRAVAEAFGYTPEELAAIPAAARKVGTAGKAIGIDMTQEMIDRARQNAAKLGLANVEFHLATIDRLPLPDASVDCAISNCVINLAPDKPAVFREIFRVLKPGGRLAVSDIALKKQLPDEVGQSLLAYVGCIAGAIAIPEYESALAAAGFKAVKIADTGKDLNAYAKVENQGGCCSPAMTSDSGLPMAASGGGSPSTVHGGLAELLRKYDVNDYAASVQVYAVKER